MSTAGNRYKLLLSYLPGMSTVVNSFQSDAVQQQVYQLLIDALSEKEGFAQETPVATGKTVAKTFPSHSGKKNGATRIDDPELVHDIIDGGSIHSEMED